MNFNEFVSEVKDNIKLFLPEEYENVEVSTMECQQLNRAYTGLMVRKEGEMLTPTINLNQLYEAYKAQPGVTMETVCRKIADIVIEAPIQVDLKSILNYEDVKDKLFIRVSSAEANKEVLENAPHQLKEDLAITYHVAVGKDQDGLSSMFIKNDLLEQYGISAEQLHEDAMKSSPHVMIPEVSSIGALIDEMYKLDSLTVQENIAVPLTLLHESAKTIDKKVMELAELFGIASQLKKYPSELSGGQRQRVAAARAMVKRPPLIFADEPTGALDSSSATELLFALSEVNQALGTTILMVTHDPYAASYTDRILYFKDGHIISELKRCNRERREFYEEIMQEAARQDEKR